MRVMVAQKVLTSAPALAGAVRAGCLAFDRPKRQINIRKQMRIVKYDIQAIAGSEKLVIGWNGPPTTSRVHSILLTGVIR